MKIVFFGSSQFAVPSLNSLVENGYDIACVVTQPDREKGRGMHLESTVVKNLACAMGLEVIQPERADAAETIAALKKIKPDLFVVIAYGQILTQEVLNIPQFFSLNLHASLLPRYRGAAPINWALIKGEEASGVTVIKMARKMDAGPMLKQKKIAVSPTDTAVSLEKKLSLLGAQALLESISDIKKNKYKFTAQDESKATFAPKLKKEDGLIEWESPARQILNLVRGTLNWPGAFTYYKGKIFKMIKARVVSDVEGKIFSVGEVAQVSKKGITVACGKEYLVIEELQIEGKRVMSAQEFIAGHKISIGEKFSKF